MAKTIMETVNLDALIEREDFDRLDDNNASSAAKLGRELYIATLTPEDRLAVMRKPDFQRETSGWSPEIVSEFIKSVADGDVVPALIMWRSPKSGNTFVIDGAHRLSALVAWVNDDYGDGFFSRAFYERISEQQIQTAQKTRALVEQKVGRYADLKRFAKEVRSAPSPLAISRGQNILSNPLGVQPIEGDARAAEHSYLRINSTAVPISPTEVTLIDSRRLATGIATRALMRAGRGYEYWSHFDEPQKSRIKETAALVYDQLIRPITDYPILALDLPTPSRGYSANSLKTILDLVTILNAAPPGTKKNKAEDDLDGSGTVQHLDQVRRVTERVFGRKHSGSLAFHPALYCYDIRGKFVPKALIGAIEFVRDLDNRKMFFEFTKHRKDFEDFLVRHSHIMTQIGRSQGSGGRRGVSAVKTLYVSLFESLRAEKPEDEIIESMTSDRALEFLDWREPIENDGGEKFSKSDKAQAVIRKALETDICPECGGRLYIKDRSYDHDQRKADGGKSVASNVELMHPYCNTGYKEARAAKAKKAMNENEGAE